jgi:DNA-binding transcriptional LysR family regulator
MKLNAFDLNLLLVFDALMRTRNVTAAGSRLGLTQSATSYCLQRLRASFNDPLFVRAPKGMVPTDRALEMAQPVRDALDSLRVTLEGRTRFDLAASTRTFSILMSDMGQFIHLPRIVMMLRSEAPNISLTNLAIPLHSAAASMASGDVDLALGFLPDIGADMHRKVLFSEEWVCVVSKKHRTIRSNLNVDKYFNASHASFQPAIAAHARLDELLEKSVRRKLQRRICLTVPYLSGLAEVVASTDLIVTIPSGWANTMAKSAAVKVMPLPLSLPKFEVTMQWHDRVHRDAGHEWLRNAISKIYLSKPEP